MGLGPGPTLSGVGFRVVPLEGFHWPGVVGSLSIWARAPKEWVPEFTQEGGVLQTALLLFGMSRCDPPLGEAINGMESWRLGLGPFDVGTTPDAACFFFWPLLTQLVFGHFGVNGSN